MHRFGTCARTGINGKARQQASRWKRDVQTRQNRRGPRLGSGRTSARGFRRCHRQKQSRLTRSETCDHVRGGRSESCDPLWLPCASGSRAGACGPDSMVERCVSSRFSLTFRPFGGHYGQGRAITRRNPEYAKPVLYCGLGVKSNPEAVKLTCALKHFAAPTVMDCHKTPPARGKPHEMCLFASRPRDSICRHGRKTRM